MNRNEFMKQLEHLLRDIPESDRQDAIAYYNGYFDEAGPENEAAVIQELGNPGKVAGIIKADLRENGNSQAEYTEQGYTDGRERVHLNTPTRRENGYREPKPRSRMPLALIIILLVFASPILLGVGGGLLGGFLGIFGGLLGVVAGIFGASFGCLIGGGIAVVAGVVKLIFNPLAGLVMIALGALVFAVGMLFMVLFAWMVVKWLPALFRWFINLCQRLINKGTNRHEKTEESEKEESRS